MTDLLALSPILLAPPTACLPEKARYCGYRNTISTDTFGYSSLGGFIRTRLSTLCTPAATTGTPYSFAYLALSAPHTTGTPGALVIFRAGFAHFRNFAATQFDYAPQGERYSYFAEVSDGFLRTRIWTTFGGLNDNVFYYLLRSDFATGECSYTITDDDTFAFIDVGTLTLPTWGGVRASFADAATETHTPGDTLPGTVSTPCTFSGLGYTLNGTDTFDFSLLPQDASASARRDVPLYYRLRVDRYTTPVTFSAWDVR